VPAQAKQNDFVASRVRVHLFCWEFLLILHPGQL